MYDSTTISQRAVSWDKSPAALEAGKVRFPMIVVHQARAIVVEDLIRSRLTVVESSVLAHSYIKV